jgi:hypothetical protein
MDHHHDRHCTNQNCIHMGGVATQSLQELQFTNGIWLPAMNGNVSILLMY